MIIEEADFRMTSGASDHFWDLELLYTVRPKGKPERQEFKDAGFGMPLETCIRKVIHHRISSKRDVGTLKEYVQDYKEEVKRLEELLNSSLVEKMVADSKLAKSLKS